MRLSYTCLIIGILQACRLTSAAHDLAKSKCQQYSKYKQPNLAQYLYIVGGTDAERDEFPHMAAIGFGDFSDQKNLSFQCGGSLISELFVLSAAHCARDSVLGRASAVRLGTIDASIIDEHTQIVPIIKEYSHPDFSESSKYNDIALFKMSHKVAFTDFIVPACLPYEPSPWTLAEAIGFGKTAYENSEGNQILMKVSLDKIDEAVCQKTYHIKNEPSGMYSIVGITSYGKFCGFANSPAIYTNVSHYIDWIEGIVWPK